MMRIRNVCRGDLLAGAALFAVVVAAGGAVAQETQAPQTPPPAPAAAEAKSGPTVSVNVAATSDYIFRGVSQTQEDPAFQVGADVTWNMLYAGAWASNVDFGTGDHVELDLYAGIKPVIAGWTVDVGGVAYLYPGEEEGADEAYVEAKLGVSRSFDRVSVGATAFWSPDFFGTEDEATYVQGDLGFKATDRLTLSGAVGRQWVSSDADYTTWNAGATFAITEKVSADLRYYDTNRHELGDIYDARVVGALKAVF